jgi:hypothetical protein
MSLRFGHYVLGVSALAVALTAVSVFRALGSQADQTSVPISASGEVLRFSGGSVSLPPPNGPGATPAGRVTARLSPVPPQGRPKLAHALGYFSLSSDATIDITGSFILTLKSHNDSPCAGVQTGLEFLGASGWDDWQAHLVGAELGCDTAGDFVATLYPQRLRISPGSPIVLAVVKRRSLPR